MPTGVYTRTEKHRIANKESHNRPEVIERMKIVVKEAMNRPEVKEKLRIAREGKTYEEIMGEEKAKEAKKKQSESHTGRPNSKEHNENISKGRIGMQFSEEHIQNIRKSHIGKSNSKERNEKIREATKRHWADPEAKEKHLKAIFKGLRLLPNKPEKFLTQLLQQLCPNQWKYVGDGQCIIGGKNPDFINIAGRKIIEHFGDYHHGERVMGIPNEQHEQERIDLFARCGFQTLIIWEYELSNVEILVNKITEFNEE